MVSVAGAAVADYFSEDGGVAGAGVFIFFHHEHRGSLRHHESAATAVEGQAGLEGIPLGSQCAGVCKAGKGHRIEHSLAAACDYHVGSAVFEGDECLPDGVGAGCAGAQMGHTGTLGVQLDGYVPTCDVGDDHRYIKRGNPRRAFVKQNLSLQALITYRVVQIIKSLQLVFISVFGSGTWKVIISLGIVFVPSFARIVRGEFLRCRNLDYVRSARLMGAGDLRIMFVHILPNTIPVVLSSAVIGFNNAVLAEAGMSFLGIGVQPPDSSLGRMLSEAQSYLFVRPGYAVCTGLAIALLILGFAMLSEGLEKNA